MKKSLKLALLLLIMFMLSNFSSVLAASTGYSLSEKMKGKFLLQTEDKGRIWYVSPSNLKRYEVTLANALTLFEKLSLGVSNKNLNLISATKPTALGNRLKGKLLLQVEDQGNIWYIDMDGLKHPVVRAGLLDLFRMLSLGITNANLDKIATGNLLTLTKNNFTNTYYNISFSIPDGYLAHSNHYGVEDATKAGNFFFRKKSDNYSDVPALNISTALKLSSGQTFFALVNQIYKMNTAKHYALSNLVLTRYDGENAYEFDIKNGFVTMNGSLKLVSLPGKVVYIYKNGKIFELLRSGNDSGLDSILESIRF